LLRNKAKECKEVGTWNGEYTVLTKFASRNKEEKDEAERKGLGRLRKG
jgi:hypothetical protein